MEHVKRYTTVGMGTDQGKTANVNGLAILADALGKTVPEVGFTTYRPPYTPVTFGALAGRDTGPLMDPMRRTAMHEWHEEHGAVFEPVGQWHRPWWYPRPGEDKHAAVARECRAVRDAVGILDASHSARSTSRGRTRRPCSTWSTPTLLDPEGGPGAVRAHVRRRRSLR